MNYTEEELKIFDKIVYKTMVNFYTISKNNGKIYLKGIDKKNEEDLCLLTIAKIASGFWGFKIYTDLNPIQNLLLSKKLKIKPKLKSYSTETDEVILSANIKEFVSNSENKMNNVYKEIYNVYYKKEKKNVTK